MDRSDVASALKQHLEVDSVAFDGAGADSADVVVVSGDAPFSVLDGARAIAFVTPIANESAWIAEWTARGLRRDLTFGEAVLVRRDDGPWRAATEAKLGALVCEVAARALVALEYHQELVARDRRDVETEYLSAKTQEDTVGDPRVWNVAQGMSELRRRLAPAKSLRTRALDIAFAGIQHGQDGFLRVLDVRDTILDHVRARISR